MSEIFTITGNLLAETTSVYKMPTLGQTARAIGDSTFLVGGKGINVSRNAIKLGEKSTAVIFPAGDIGKRCLDKLAQENIPTISSNLEGQTRSGLVCVDESTGLRTTFLGSDVNVCESAFNDIINKLGKFAKSNDIIALCGSFPNWNSQYVDDILGLANKNNLRVCVDTYGKPLADFVDTKFDLLKINFDELKILLKGYQIDTSDCEASFRFAKSRFFQDVEIFIVTNSKHNILAFWGDKFYTITPQKVENALYETGCGDAFFASFISNFFCKKISFETALKSATAYATSQIILNS